MLLLPGNSSRHRRFVVKSFGDRLLRRSGDRFWRRIRLEHPSRNLEDLAGRSEPGLIRNGEVPNEPTMTPLEYSQRSARWRRAYAWYTGEFVTTFLACCLIGSTVADNQRLPEDVANAILYTAGFFAAVCVALFGRFRRQPRGQVRRRLSDVWRFDRRWRTWPQ
jgi:hypothetical protein